MLNLLRGAADRLVGMVAPRATAGACACGASDFTDYCIGQELVRCWYNCWCQVSYCRGIGQC